MDALSTTVETATPNVTIGANFEGADRNIAFGAFPPDTDGAVGPNQFVELLNGVYRVYDKQGQVLQQTTLADFWNAAGAVPDQFPYDPRVLYDPTTQRWFATSDDGANGPDSHFLLAVSKTSDATEGWAGLSIRSDPSGKNFSDFPTLGINQDGVFLSAGMFPLADVPFYTRIVAIPKADLLGDDPTSNNATEFSNFVVNPSFIDSIVQQPAVAFQSSGPEPLLSLYDPFQAQVKISSIDGPITAPALNTDDRAIDVPPAFAALLASQKGTPDPLEVRTAIFRGSAVLQDGDLYGVQHVILNGQLALRWFEVGDPLGTPVILDSGVIQSPSMDFYDASIAVNSLGEAVIGFSGSGPDDYVSAFAVAGTRVRDHLVFGDPMLLKAGVAPYVGGNQRWGDYSATTVDPSDPSHFWTIQAWAAGGDASGGGVWATEVSEIVFGVPQPTPNVQTWFGGTGRFEDPQNWLPTGSPTATATLAVGAGTVRAVDLAITNPNIFLGSPTDEPKLVLHDSTLDAATHIRVQTTSFEVPQPDLHATIRIVGSVTENGAIEVGTTGIDVHQLFPAHLEMDMALNSTFLNAPGAIWFSSDGSTIEVDARGRDTTFVNNGEIEAFGGTVKMDAPVSGNGSFDILFNNDRIVAGTVEFGREVSQGQTINLDAGLLKLDRPAQFHGTIQGFDAEGTIELEHTRVTSVEYSDGVLTLFRGREVEMQLNISGDYTTDQFVISNHDGDAFVTVKPPASNEMFA